MYLSVFLLLSSVLPAPLHAGTHSIESIKALVAAKGGGDGETPGPYAERGVKVLLDNRFEYFPWEYTMAGRIKNGYGMKAFIILAENYTEISEEILNYCSQIDNEYALLSFEALARQYATLYAWQIHWASEVQSGREYGAYSGVVSSRHSEKQEAEAALLDGLKSEVSISRERRETARIEKSFSSLLRDSLAALPSSCRLRLSGAEVTIREMHEPGIPASTLLRYERPSPSSADPEACSERRPGRLTFYWGPYYVAHGEGGKAALQALMETKLGCRAVRKAPVRLSRIFTQHLFITDGTRDDMRDALRDAPAPLKVKKVKKSCPLVRYQAPRVIISSRTDSRTAAKTVKVTANLITEGMETHFAEPSKTPAHAAADEAPPTKLVVAH